MSSNWWTDFNSQQQQPPGDQSAIDAKVTRWLAEDLPCSDVPVVIQALGMPGSADGIVYCVRLQVPSFKRARRRDGRRSDCDAQYVIEDAGSTVIDVPANGMAYPEIRARVAVALAEIGVPPAKQPTATRTRPTTSGQRLHNTARASRETRKATALVEAASIIMLDTEQPGMAWYTNAQTKLRGAVRHLSMAVEYAAAAGDEPMRAELLNDMNMLADKTVEIGDLL